jgi:adenylate kinase
MKVLGRPKAIVIYGAPGAGKGTQADLLANYFGFVHFDTGKYLESLIYNSAHKNKPSFKRERKFFESGKLMTPSWVLQMVKQRTIEIAKANLGIIFSGSPRTVGEAKGLLAALEKLYGKKNLIFLVIQVNAKTSLKRNSHRLVCTVCESPVLFTKETEHFNTKSKCPFCGGKLFKRTLDRPKIIKRRITEYNLRTKPIFEEIKRRGYKIHLVTGKALPFEVFKKIKAHIKIS